jgi:DNA-binding protein HU-beta
MVEREAAPLSSAVLSNRKPNTSGGGCKKVTKAELVTEVAKATGLNKKASGAAVGAVFEAIENSLAKGEKVQLVGFGTFEVRERAAREGRNPQDPKKVIKIPAKKVPVFRPGKALKDKVE